MICSKRLLLLGNFMHPSLNMLRGHCTQRSESMDIESRPSQFEKSINHHKSQNCFRLYMHSQSIIGRSNLRESRVCQYRTQTPHSRHIQDSAQDSSSSIKTFFGMCLIRWFEFTFARASYALHRIMSEILRV